MVGVALPVSTLSDQPLQCRFGDRRVPATPTTSTTTNNNARTFVCISPLLDDMEDPTPTTPSTPTTIEMTITTMDGEILSPPTTLTLLRPPPVVHLEPLFLVQPPNPGLSSGSGASPSSVAFTVVLGVALDQVGVRRFHTLIHSFLDTSLSHAPLFTLTHPLSPLHTLFHPYTPPLSLILLSGGRARARMHAGKHCRGDHRDDEPRARASSTRTRAISTRTRASITRTRASITWTRASSTRTRASSTRTRASSCSRLHLHALFPCHPSTHPHPQHPHPQPLAPQHPPLRADVLRHALLRHVHSHTRTAYHTKVPIHHVFPLSDLRLFLSIPFLTTVRYSNLLSALPSILP